MNFLKNFNPGELVADAALSKLKKHMEKEGIPAYIAYHDAEGEFHAVPMKAGAKIPGFVILTEQEHENIKKFIAQKTQTK